MKIAIIGYSGSGKSTLAKKLSKLYNINVLHLDSVHFLENWVERSNEEMNELVLAFMNDNKDGWVIDGNYSKIAKNRFEEADLIIFLNFNRFFCFKSAFKRYKENKGKTRSDMALGCEEKFDFEFMKWILYKGRNKRKRLWYKNIISNHKCTLVFKNRRQLTKYYNKIGE